MDKSFHGEAPGRPALEGMGSREETIALWQSVCGKSIDDFEWYEAFTRLKVAVLSIRMARLKNLPTPDDAAIAVQFSALR